VYMGKPAEDILLRPIELPRMANGTVRYMRYLLFAFFVSPDRTATCHIAG
jgi:hypothetical protein